MPRRLYRSRSHSLLWGVCAGIAEFFHIDPVFVRLVFVLLSFASGIGVVVYIFLTVALPVEGSSADTPRQTIKDNWAELGKEIRSMGKKVREGAQRMAEKKRSGSDGERREL